jgi:hypothetical protein
VSESRGNPATESPANPGSQPPASVTEEVSEERDNPIERLQLLAGDDGAIAAFLDDLDVKSPQEREMLSEIAQTTALARPERFLDDHKRAVNALESLRRHGFHGSRVAGSIGPLRLIARWLVETFARYVVVSYIKSVVKSMRNPYWVREMQSADGSREKKGLRRPWMDAEALCVIMESREIGIPSFLLLLLIPLLATIWRLASGFTFGSWWEATLVALVGIAIGIGLSWVMLRGTALAGRRIRISTREPLLTLWQTVGWCGNPPKDQSRKLAIIGITLMAGVWIVLPALVGLWFAF